MLVRNKLCSHTSASPIATAEAGTLPGRDLAIYSYSAARPPSTTLRVVEVTEVQAVDIAATTAHPTAAGVVVFGPATAVAVESSVEMG